MEMSGEKEKIKERVFFDGNTRDSMWIYEHRKVLKKTFMTSNVIEVARGTQCDLWRRVDNVSY